MVGGNYSHFHQRVHSHLASLYITSCHVALNNAGVEELRPVEVHERTLAAVGPIKSWSLQRGECSDVPMSSLVFAMKRTTN